MVDSYVLWEADAEEVIDYFLTSEFTANSLAVLLEYFNLGACDKSNAPIDATQLVLIHNTQDVILAASEIEYLKFAPKVISTNNVAGFNVFAMEIEDSERDFYYIMAAIIKIVNLAFGGENLFLMKNQQKLSIGCKRDFEDMIPNNFCQSDLMGAGKELANLLGTDYFTLQDFAPAIMECSSLEYLRAKFDSPHYNTEAITALIDIEYALKLDLSSEKEEYIKSFIKDAHMCFSHSDICAVLKYIAEPKDILSSYEVLNTAEAATEKVLQAQVNMNFGAESEIVSPHSATMFDKDTLSNAECLLRAIEKRNDIMQATELPSLE